MADNAPVKFTVKVPLWVHIYLAWLVRLKHAGFNVDADKAGKFIMRHIKIRPA